MDELRLCGMASRYADEKASAPQARRIMSERTALVTGTVVAGPRDSREALQDKALPVMESRIRRLRQALRTLGSRAPKNAVNPHWRGMLTRAEQLSEEVLDRPPERPEKVCLANETSWLSDCHRNEIDTERQSC